jgi:hypothetical protein
MVDILVHLPAYLRARFPIHVYGPALSLAYVSSVGVLSSAAGRGPDVFSNVCALCAFVLLFLLVRLLDDIADALSDGARPILQERPARAYRRILVHLFIGVSVVVIGISLVLHVPVYGALVISLIAIQPAVKMALGPSTREHSTGSIAKDLLYAVVHEGSHFAICLYVYVAWRASSDVDVSPKLVFVTTTLVWALFLIWKYSRAISRPGWEPYGLVWSGMRAAIVLLIILSVASQLAIFRQLRFSLIYAVPLLLVGIGASVALFWTAPRQRHARRHFGMLFVLANLMILVVSTMAPF